MSSRRSDGANDGLTRRRVLRRTLLTSGAALVVVVLALVAINAFDATLSPEAQRMLAARLPGVPPEQNLFFYLAGFEAPAGGSPLAYGRARGAEHARIAALPVAQQRAALRLTPARLEYVGAQLCEPLSASCWARVDERAAEIRTALRENLELYQRYLYLHSVPSFEEGVGPSLVPLTASVPAKLRALFLANVALRMRTVGDVQDRVEALDDLRRDVLTWRRVLVGDPMLISAMIAVANLHADFALFADMVADGAVPLDAHAQRIEALLGAIDESDWKIPAAIANESRFLAVMLRGVRDEPTQLFPSSLGADDGIPPSWQHALSPVLLHLFKPNATLNLATAHMTALRKAASGEARDYLREIQTLREWRRRNLDPAPHFVYNPAGKWMLGLHPEAWDGYALRAFDVAALQRAAKLGYEIRKQRIATPAIAAFMREHPEWSTHPASGEAFTFDAQAHEVALNPLGDARLDRRFRIPVWRSR